MYLLHPVARIALVSEDRARQVEMIILRMFQMGQITKVTEDQLIGLLEQVRVSLSSEDGFLSHRRIYVKADDAQSKAQPKKGAIVVRTRLLIHAIASPYMPGFPVSKAERCLRRRRRLLTCVT